MRQIVGSKKTSKSKSVSQSRRKRTWNQKHDTWWWDRNPLLPGEINETNEWNKWALRKIIDSKKTNKTKLVSQSRGRRLWNQKHETLKDGVATRVCIEQYLKTWDFRNIKDSNKTYKFKSISQSRGKRQWNPKHDTLMVEFGTCNLKDLLYEYLTSTRANLHRLYRLGCSLLN